MQNEITLTVGQTRGLVLAAATTDVRYYLNGVLFELVDGRAVATDGSALLAVNLPDAIIRDDKYPSVIIDRETLAAICKGGKVSDIITVFYGADGLHLERANGISINSTPIDGRFPEYQRIMPDEVSGEPAQFNIDLLARISKALRLACDAGRDKAPLIGYNGNSGALIAFSGYGGTAIAVCMPMRIAGNANSELSAFGL